MIAVRDEKGLGGKLFAGVTATIGYHRRFGLVTEEAAISRASLRRRRGLPKADEGFEFRFVAGPDTVMAIEGCSVEQLTAELWRIETSRGAFLVGGESLPETASFNKESERPLHLYAPLALMFFLPLIFVTHSTPPAPPAPEPVRILLAAPKPTPPVKRVSPPKEAPKLASRTKTKAKPSGAAVAQNLGILALVGKKDLAKAVGGLPTNLKQATAGAGPGGKAGSGGELLVGLGAGVKRASVGNSGVKGLGGVGNSGAGGGAGGYGDSLLGSGGAGNGLAGTGNGRALAAVPLSEEMVLDGGLDKSVIQATIAKYLSQVRACYENGLQKVPGLAGQVTMEFEIGSSGALNFARVMRSSLSNDDVESCIKSRMMGWRFPKPVGGVQVKVSYPFLLRTNA